MTEPGAPANTVRAGFYAEFDGVIWPVNYYPSSGLLGLLSYSDEPPWSDHDEPWREGLWERGVPREACTRLFWVATSAYWAGVYPAEVRRARGNGLVEIQCSPPSPDPGPPGAIRGLDWAAPRQRLCYDPRCGLRGRRP